VDLADGGALHLYGEAVVHPPHQAVAGVRVASPRVPSVVGTEVTGGEIHVSHGVRVHHTVSPASVVRAVRARRDTDGEVAAAQVAVVVMINGGNHHHQAILREVVVITTRLK